MPKFDDIKAGGWTDPDEYIGPVYTRDMLRARLAHLQKVRESWKGQSAYLETIDMEIWAISLAAAMMTIGGRAIFEASDDLGFQPDRLTFGKMVMVSMGQLFATAKQIEAEHEAGSTGASGDGLHDGA